MNEDQTDELEALDSIFGDSCVTETKDDAVVGSITVHPEVTMPFALYVPARMAATVRRAPPLHVNDGRAEYRVEALPPMTLGFTLPPSYPEKEPPHFTLSCPWLNEPQLSKLCQELDQLWDAQQGEPILFTWAQFLQDDTAATVNLSKGLPVRVIHRTEKERFPGLRFDDRAYQDSSHTQALLEQLLDYSEERIRQEFDSKLHNCGVCLATRKGTDCIRFICCHHVFCRECVSGYFESQIKQGSFQGLKCPEPSCGKQALPTEIKQLVAADLYDKYESLTLEHALSNMADTQVCPRLSCQLHVIIEPNSDTGLCEHCGFSFCIFCKKASHGIEPCKTQDMEAVIKEYEAADAEARSLLEARYGVRKLQQGLAELKSAEFVRQNAKSCPTCKADISKVDGCNKMLCSRCGVPFCWLCERPLDKANPYAHFNSGACHGMLFEGMLEDDFWDEDDDLFDLFE